MRFSCDRAALVEKLNVLARGVSSRSALPRALRRAAPGARRSSRPLLHRHGAVDQGDPHHRDRSRGRGGRPGAALHRRGQEHGRRPGASRVGRGLGAYHRRQGGVHPELLGGERFPSHDDIRHGAFLHDRFGASGRDAREGGARGLSRRDAPDPHRCAGEDGWRHAQDGRDRQLSVECQRDAGSRAAPRTNSKRSCRSRP